MVMFTVSFEDGGLMQRLEGISIRSEGIPEEKWNEVGEVLLKSVRENFEKGGRPTQWIPSKKLSMRGGKTLIESGALMNSGHISSQSENHVELEWGQGLPYALIHQMGGVIEQILTDKQRRFFLRMHYMNATIEKIRLKSAVRGLSKLDKISVQQLQLLTKQPSDKWKAMALSAVLFIKEPSRRYVSIQDQDVVDVANILSNYLLHGNETFSMTVQ